MNKSNKTAGAFEVTIEKLVYGGAGFCRHQGKVVFVPFAAPGDCLLVRRVEEKKTYIRAEIVRILKHGKGRVSPPCPYFEKCGGCHWQHVEYCQQIEAKRFILEEILHHRFPQTRELPITMRGCAYPFGYRSRARMQLQGAGNRAKVGFFRSGSHSVQDVESCPLFRPALNEALSSLRQFKFKVDTDSKPREMDMACSQEEDTWATASVGTDDSRGITILFGTRRGEEVILKRKIGGFQYSATASVFFQANDFMVPELVALIRESVKDAGDNFAIDLFSGVGLLSLPLAQQFKNVIAIENSPPACRLCSKNASTAGFSNLQAVCADVSDWMKSETSFRSQALNLIVLDPPRVGAGDKVMGQILEWAPEMIIYVSCDPQTLARDLARIPAHDYRIDLVEGLDMFPQTYHFETVVRLRRN